MSANIFFLYAATVLIWGTTWLGIKLQLGSVDPMVSVLYRFIAAALVLMVAATGAVKVKTTVLLTAEEIDAATQKVVSYRPPGQ